MRGGREGEVGQVTVEAEEEEEEEEGGEEGVRKEGDEAKSKDEGATDSESERCGWLLTQNSEYMYSICAAEWRVYTCIYFNFLLPHFSYVCACVCLHV